MIVSIRLQRYNRSAESANLKELYVITFGYLRYERDESWGKAFFGSVEFNEFEVSRQLKAVDVDDSETAVCHVGCN